MYNWSVKQQFPIFKNVGGVIRTIGVSNMQYYAKKWLSSTYGFFIFNIKNQILSNMHISEICTIDMQNNFPYLKL